MSIIAFEHRDFSGERQTFDAGYYQLPDHAGFSGVIANDTLSSFVVAPFTSVTFYEHYDRGGVQLTIANPSAVAFRQPYVGDFWNDRISALEVSTVLPFPLDPPPPDQTTPGLAGVILFEAPGRQASFSGPVLSRARRQTFGLGEYELPHQPAVRFGNRPAVQLGVRPKMVSSIEVGRGYYVELFEGPNQTGASRTIGQTVDILPAGEDGRPWDDRAVSIAVRRLPVPR